MVRGARDGFPADPTLAQLGIAVDPASMCRVLQEHLRPASHTTYRIDGCRLVRIRYRPRVRCFLQYALRLIDGGTGAESTQWVTAALYADGGKAERLWRRARADRPGTEAADALFEAACFVPDLQMMVQVFPYDRRLPSLPAMLHRSPWLEGSLLQDFGPGDWRIEGWAADPIRYREQLGVVLRYTVRARDAVSGRLDSRRFYAKLYTDDRGARTMQTLHALHERRRGRNCSLGVVRPVKYLDDMRALVLEEARGFPLETALTASGDVAGVLRAVARSMAAFHAEDLPRSARRWSRADQLAAMEKWRMLLGWACPPLQSDVDAVARSVAAALEEVEARPAHRDLKPDHLFVEADRITAIDLDSFAGADPVVDLALLLAHLAAVPQSPASARERAREAMAVLADEYLARVPVGWGRRLPIHYARALLGVAVDSFHLQRPQWRDEVAALVGEARDAVSGTIA